MLDRERSVSTSAAASGGQTAREQAPVGGSIEAKEPARSQRATIVPQAFEDLDSEPTRQHSPVANMGNLNFELDDPDLFDSELDEPTLIAHDSKSSAGRRETELTGERSKSTQRRIEPAANVARHESSASVLPKVPSQHPAARNAPSQRPLSQPPRTAVVPTAKPSQPPTEGPKPEKWYLRVQLNTDCVADLWVRDMTPHNVLVWHEGMETWVPLLTVRELRDAIRDAHDAKTRDQLRESNFVFVQTQPHGEDHQPLPKPRLPAGMSSAPTAPPTSHWSVPKSRTISNVPPPLLTTSVPVVGAAPSRGANPHFLASSSTVPPVVTSIGQTPDLHAHEDWVPQIPRPSRVPAVTSVMPYAADTEPRTVEPIAGLPTPRQQPYSTEVFRQTAIQKVSNEQALVVAQKATPAAPSQALVHLERVLWLAAGVAVASATMLVMRDPGRSRNVAVVQPVAARVGVSDTPRSPDSSGEATETKPVAKSGHKTAHRRNDDVHHLEDLPIIGQKEVSSVAAKAPKGSGRSASSGRGRAGRSSKSGDVVAAETVTLAATTAVSPVSTAAASNASGGFNTSTARRVLTSSASRAGRCASEGPASGSVIVTFAPTGFVQKASMSGLSGKGVNVGCVLRAFQEARVSPFSGSAVTVRKGFQIL